MEREAIPSLSNSPLFSFLSVSYRSDCSNQDQSALIHAVLAVHLSVTVQRLGTLVSPKVHFQLLEIPPVPPSTKLTLHARVYGRILLRQTRSPKWTASASTLLPSGSSI